MTVPTRLLRGERIRLTALNDGDVAALAHWDEDSQFLRLYDARPAHPRSEAEITQRLQGLRDDERTIAFAIRPLNGDELIGTFELDGILWPHRVCGLAIAIGNQEHWGHGYGYEAAQLGLTFAFEELNLHRVTATVFS
jgi:RimJ/RimL family protein N-acetyltransferase